MMQLTAQKLPNKLTPAERRRILLARISQQRGRVEFHHGSWRVTYWLRDLTTASGWRQVHDRLNASTYNEAVIEAAAIIAKANEHNQLGQGVGRAPTVKEFSETEWKKYLERRGRRPATLRSYASMMRKYVVLIEDKRINLVKSSDIELVLDAAKDKSAKTRVNLFGFLQVFFEVAQQHDLIARSPVRTKIHKPVSRKVKKPALTSELMWQLLGEIPLQYRLIFVTAALTAYRAGELLAFCWENFDADAGTLQATHEIDNGKRIEGVKTSKSEDVIQLARALTVELQEHRDKTEWNGPQHLIFSQSDGAPYDPGFLRKEVLYPALKRIGVVVGSRTHGFHMFRHTAATLVADATHDPMMVRDLLRHEKLSTTAGYIKTASAQGASEILADEIFGKHERVN